MFLSTQAGIVSPILLCPLCFRAGFLRGIRIRRLSLVACPCLPASSKGSWAGRRLPLCRARQQTVSTNPHKPRLYSWMSVYTDSCGRHGRVVVLFIMSGWRTHSTHAQYIATLRSARPHRTYACTLWWQNLRHTDPRGPWRARVCAKCNLGYSLGLVPKNTPPPDWRALQPVPMAEGPMVHPRWGEYYY